MIPFALPDITDSEIAAVIRCMKNGWLTSGQVMKDFEEDVKEYLETDRHCIAVSSATAGLHLALIALGVGKGDAVMLPTLTFASTIEVVVAVGAHPILCDVDYETRNMTPQLMQKALDNYNGPAKLRAVIPVHFAGSVCNMDEMMDWAEFHNVYVIEDAAHAFGSVYKSVRVGNYHSDVTVFSFYATKCITTGEGGMIVCNDDIAYRIKCLRMHGISRDVFDRYTSKSSGWEYDVVEPGWKYNMPDLMAAIGREQLKRELDMRCRREALEVAYERLIGELGLKDRVRTPEFDASSSHHLYCIEVKNRNVVADRMKKKGVGVSVHFKPLHMMTAYKSLGEGNRFDNAEKYYEGCLSLPLYSTMVLADVAFVAEALSECIC